jgi:hypothetical protein
MPESSDPKPQQATGLSIAAIIILSTAFLAVLALHLVQTDLDPVRDVMSGYANGPFGNLMTFSFYALGIGTIVLAVRLRRSTDRSWAPITISMALGLGGLALILAGVFEVERPGVPDTLNEIVHSNGAIAGFVLIVIAMVLFPYVCYRDERWESFLVPSLSLAIIAVAAAAFSPVAPSTTIAGLAQRVLAVVVFGWVLLVAIWMRFRIPPSGGGGDHPG